MHEVMADVLATNTALRAQLREERRRTMCALYEIKKAADAELARLEALEKEARDESRG